MLRFLNFILILVAPAVLSNNKKKVKYESDSQDKREVLVRLDHHIQQLFEELPSIIEKTRSEKDLEGRRKNFEYGTAATGIMLGRLIRVGALFLGGTTFTNGVFLDTLGDTLTVAGYAGARYIKVDTELLMQNKKNSCTL
ncbi:uncharacterized protein LOC111709781 isoform X2 [Eurytemora carolleeae]|uniref:uncharacterized protein LOC111709781 isoform X2 n=1 Tax=Eurytemora carolleeae TaxID=1294199 RepID=UPI000C791546|nr:uncharacterized protein LOC111709781 isoform X2 [Eurytemora carolleeae]|eukprot:XP_023339457.1 uncharacterized protein LOC111709781 isoform X2 [Eurytemora affinis]